jgi:hypothetical protein
MNGHFAITLFPSRRNASKTPCASRDPYPWPDSSCGTSVWSRARRLLVGDCERAVAEGHFKPAHCWIVPDTAAASGASCVWTNGDGWWIRRAIRGVTFPPRRRAARSTLFARRRAGPLRSGTIARELHIAPNIIPVLHGTNGQQALREHSRRALEAE